MSTSGVSSSNKGGASTSSQTKGPSTGSNSGVNQTAKAEAKPSTASDTGGKVEAVKDGVTLSKELSSKETQHGVNLDAWSDSDKDAKATSDPKAAETEKPAGQEAETPKETKPNADLAASLGNRTLKNGMHDESVRSLQAALNDQLGLELETDGKFGDKTLDAVKEFQRRNGLDDDGIVGQKTKDALAGMGKQPEEGEKAPADQVADPKTGENTPADPKAGETDPADPKAGEGVPGADGAAPVDETGKPTSRSYGQKLSDGQKASVDQMVADLKAKGFEVKPDDIINFMAVETAGTFSPSIRAGGKKNGAVGLAQFTQTAIDDMNRFRGKGNKLTKSKLAAMSFDEQSKVVTEYLSTALGRKNMQGKEISAADLYTAVFSPAAIGKSMDSTIYSLNGSARNYRANKSLDTNNDGKITKAELTARLNDWVARGEQLRG